MFAPRFGTPLLRCSLPQARAPGLTDQEAPGSEMKTGTGAMIVPPRPRRQELKLQEGAPRGRAASVNHLRSRPSLSGPWPFPP